MESTFESSGLELLDSIKPLWEELNKYQLFPEPIAQVASNDQFIKKDNL